MLSSNAFANEIFGFELGDTIDLTGLGFTSGAHVAFKAGRLDVTSGGTTDLLTLGGSHAAADFRLAPAGSGTAITYRSAQVGGEATLNISIGALLTAAPGNYEIDLTGNIGLTANLTAIDLPSGVSLTIEGNDHRIDGNGEHSAFFVDSGSLTLDDLTVAHAVAQGGAGGPGGGGGAGLGGGLFLGSGGSATLIGVSFLSIRRVAVPAAAGLSAPAAA